MAGFNAVMSESYLGEEHLNRVACSYQPACQQGNVSRERLGKRGEKGEFNKETLEELRLEDTRINLKPYPEELKEQFLRRTRDPTWNKGLALFPDPHSTNIHQKKLSAETGYSFQLWRGPPPTPAIGLLYHAGLSHTWPSASFFFFFKQELNTGERIQYQSVKKNPQRYGKSEHK